MTTTIIISSGVGAEYLIRLKVQKTWIYEIHNKKHKYKNWTWTNCLAISDCVFLLWLTILSTQMKSF